ncbi:hypothetical protein D7322_23680 [Sphingobacterium puteale]|uniref:Uncharacterized protein n=1 Tax=Sphingobacterium puteale TaxID=2420510 RepID=A0A420VSE6_9SPHI|nr:hypothetical protein D7322_23680 [Sphingobacterium puteale]
MLSFLSAFLKISLTQRSIAILKPVCAQKKEYKNQRRPLVIRQIIFFKKIEARTATQKYADRLRSIQHWITRKRMISGVK